VTFVRSFATEKLKGPDIANSFHMDMSNRFASLQHANDFTEQWKLFQDSIKDVIQYCWSKTGFTEEILDYG